MPGVIESEFISAKKNLNRQGTKVLQDIVNAYETGVFDDPNSSAMFCSLLACICEGKVQGVFDEETATVKWSLTTKYSAQLDALRDAMMQVGLESGKVVKGPWV
jgi:hypothetical protein